MTDDDIQEELKRRRDGLSHHMEAAIDYSESKASINHYCGVALMASAMGCTVAASVLGLFPFNVSKQVIGGLAAMPALLALIAINLKFEEKSSWHYDKSQTTRMLWRKLFNQAPIPLTLDWIIAIDKEYSEFLDRKKQEWKESLTMNFLGLRSKDKPPPQLPTTSQSSGSSAAPSPDS